MIDEISAYNDRIDTDFFQSLCNKDIIYSHVSRTNQINIDSDLSDKTLIIRDGDIPTDYNIFKKFNFKRVFCQNLNSEPSEKLQCIPIGIESVDYTKVNGWDKFEVIKQVRTYHISSDNILYANFSLNTNRLKRTQCINAFRGKNYLTDKTTIQIKHPSILTKEEYEAFCIELCRHKFVLCPEGNGIDTHRLWETLYLGRIPVVLHNYVNDSFSDLPILILNKWEDFYQEYPKFIEDVINGHKYSLEKLGFEYWRKQI